VGGLNYKSASSFVAALVACIILLISMTILPDIYLHIILPKYLILVIFGFFTTILVGNIVVGICSEIPMRW
jgi:TctA family transporter